MTGTRCSLLTYLTSKSVRGRYKNCWCICIWLVNDITAAYCKLRILLITAITVVWYFFVFTLYRPVGRVVTRSSLEREVGGLWFKSRAGQIEHCVANGSPPLQHFLERSCVAYRSNDVEMSPANSLHASAYITAIKMKYLIYLIVLFVCSIYGLCLIQDQAFSLWSKL